MGEKTIKAVFLRDSRIGESDVEYKAGQIVEMSQESFNRWDRRGAVELHTPKHSEKTNERHGK